MFDMRESECRACGQSKPSIASALGVCGECVRAGAREAAAKRAHLRSRPVFGLPVAPPESATGAPCGLCQNACVLAEGELGYCGARVNRGDRVEPHAGTKHAYVDWYHDPLPTNCVAGWACAASQDAELGGRGARRSPFGPANLAVFYHGCTFDCLFCQNWHHRHVVSEPASAEDLAEAVGRRTWCICYFGGDPVPHIEHALRASELALLRAGERSLRICWETNGSMSRSVLEQMARVSLETGGTVKFDLKAFSEPLHQALCGVSGERTRANFARLVELGADRPGAPLAAAATLLVPGYIDAAEVASIARLVASLDRSVPYSLLAFHPDDRLGDLPATPRGLAENCLTAAREAGLEHVKIGNVGLLW